MDDRSISQFLYPKAIDFSSPPLRIVLIAAIIGLMLKFACYSPYALGSAVERRLLPTEAATMGLEKLSSLGMELQDQLLTALPAEDEPLILFIRDQMGPRRGNDLLKSSVPAVFWEVSLRPR